MVSVSFAAAVILIAGIAYFTASFYDTPNPDHAFSYKLIKIMTFLSGLHSRVAIAWTTFMTFWRYW